MPWFKKYEPKNINEVIGQPINKLLNYVNNKPKSKALMIYGPSGCGKSCSVTSLNGDGFEVIEINSSMVRNADAVRQVVGGAAMNAGFFGKKVILIDDVDSVTSSDRGGLSELIKIIKKSVNPIILTTIDPWNQKLRAIRSYCELIEYKKLSSSLIKNKLKQIISLEGVKADDSVLYKIAVQANGDLRAAINNLEMLSGDGEVTEHELRAMGYREKPVSIFDGLRTLFNTPDFNEAMQSLDNVNLDFDTKMLWVTENIINEFNNPNELSSAFNNLSRADVFKGRIRRQQYWRLLFYANLLMTVGVNNSRINSKGFVKYNKPIRLMALWNSKRHRELIKELALKLSKGLNESIKKTIMDLPYLRLVLKKLMNDYELTIDEIKAIGLTTIKH